MDKASNDRSTDPLRLPQATDDNGDRNLAFILSARAALAINRLARHHQIGHRDVIERLILALNGINTSVCVALRCHAWDSIF